MVKKLGFTQNYARSRPYNLCEEIMSRHEMVQRIDHLPSCAWAALVVTLPYTPSHVSTVALGPISFRNAARLLAAFSSEAVILP